MVAPGAGCRGGTLFRAKNRSRPKKRSSLQNERVFGPKVREDKKISSPKKFLAQMNTK